MTITVSSSACSLFEIDPQDSDLLHPTALAQGPWHEGTQHGSAMLGLLARGLERHPSERPLQVTRLTADMLRAAPIGPTRVPTTTIKRGKTTDLVEARIESEGVVYARATAMRFRLEDIDTREGLALYPSERFVLPNDFEIRRSSSLPATEAEAFINALDMRVALGTESPAVWFRLKVPFVGGETNSAMVRTAIAADWAYSIPTMQNFLTQPFDHPRPVRPFTSINPDTTINLHRPLDGEWICLHTHMFYGSVGAGTAIAMLQDPIGPIGHVSQSILVRGPDKMSLSERTAREALEHSDG
jgi:hypothetical protein